MVVFNGPEIGTPPLNVFQTVEEYFYTIFDVAFASGHTFSSKYHSTACVYQNFLRKIQNIDKSDRCLESRCDQYKFFWMLIFGILPQKELYIEEMPKKKYIINFPPLFLANLKICRKSDISLKRRKKGTEL